MTATKVGKKKVLLIHINSKVAEPIISPVKYCPNAKTRLIFITSDISKRGTKLSSNDQDNIYLTYSNGNKTIFD